MAGWISLYQVTEVLRWLLVWAGWALATAFVGAGCCWCYGQAGFASWLRTRPPGPPWRAWRARAEARHGITELEGWLEQQLKR